jgi:nitroreductase
MDLIEKLNWRYATKKFDSSKKLSSEKLEILKQAFNLTPTSYGVQTMKMVIVSDEPTKNKMVELCYGQEQVKNASHVLALCIQDTVNETDVDNYFDEVVKIRNTSELILTKYRKELKDFVNSKTNEELKIWCVNQVYIALGNLMTSCAIEGIDACPMEGFLPDKIDELLDLKKHNLKSVLLLPVGYRAQDDMFAELKKVRKDISETIIEL